MQKLAGIKPQEEQVVETEEILSDKEIKDALTSDKELVKEEVITTVLFTLGVLNLLGKVFNWIKKQSLDPKQRREYEDDRAVLLKLKGEVKALDKANSKELEQAKRKEYFEKKKAFDEKHNPVIAKWLIKVSELGITAIEKVLQGVNWLKRGKIKGLDDEWKRREWATIIFVVFATVAGLVNSPDVLSFLKNILPINTVKDIINAVSNTDSYKSALKSVTSLFI
jgi:hypothetical protein